MADQTNRDKGRQNDPNKKPQQDINQKGGETSRDSDEMEDLNDMDK